MIWMKNEEESCFLIISDQGFPPKFSLYSPKFSLYTSISLTGQAKSVKVLDQSLPQQWEQDYENFNHVKDLLRRLGL